MPRLVIEGRWEDVIRRQDFLGRRVRVILLEESEPQRIAAAEWIRELRAWAHSHPTIAHFVDDSRESVYGGTLDDPR